MLNNTSKISSIFFVLCALSLPLKAMAHGDETDQESAQWIGDNTDAAKIVKQFHQALKQGDTKLAKSSLAENVLIFEGGGVERSAQEYASHHMLGDMKYLAAVKDELIEQQTIVNGDMAFSVSRTKMQGEYKGKAINYIGVETLVLLNTEAGWKIAHIHWSN